MRKTLVAITLSILLVAALGMTALGATPIKGGTLRVAVTSIQQLGLYKSASNDENDATSLIFDQLFVISKNDFQPIPHLAESWDNVGLLVPPPGGPEARCRSVMVAIDLTEAVLPLVHIGFLPLLGRHLAASADHLITGVSQGPVDMQLPQASLEDLV